MPELSNEQLLALWLDGKLSEQQHQVFARRCVEDQQFAEQVETATLLGLKADNFTPQTVPEWNRTATFTASEKTPWWQKSGLTMVSFALSVFAVVLVVSGFQIRSDVNGVTISFASQPTNQSIEKLVDEKLNVFQQNQQLVLHDFSQALQQQQLDTSSQLTQYLLTSSRKERREDFAELIKFVNEQRNDDQLFYARQINQLQQDMYTNPLPTGSNSSDK